MFYVSNLLKRKTDPKIRIIPHIEKPFSDSPNKITLNSVADMGSIMPRADAVPAGISFSAKVYKKYGNIQVHIPKLIARGNVIIVLFATHSGIPHGLLKNIPANDANIKQYKVAEKGLHLFLIAIFVTML